MTDILRLCPKCGSEIPADAPEGGWPGCLLETGLGLFADASVAGVDDPGRADKLHSKKAERLLEMLGGWATTSCCKRWVVAVKASYSKRVKRVLTARSH